MGGVSLPYCLVIGEREPESCLLKPGIILARILGPDGGAESRWSTGFRGKGAPELVGSVKKLLKWAFLEDHIKHSRKSWGHTESL